MTHLLRYPIMKYLCLALLLLDCQGLTLQKNAAEMKILFWNLQNAFDDLKDGKEYPQFDPQNGWNSQLFHIRLKNYAQLLNEYHDTDILAFAEVENDNVLYNLQKSLNQHYAYRYLLPVETQNIQMGVLSRWPLEKSYRLDAGAWGKRQLRPIISLKIKAEANSLWLVLNHWKSKRGGSNEAARQKSSRRLARHLRKLISDEPLTELVVLGDFNESHDEYYRCQCASALMPFTVYKDYDLKEQIWLGEDAKLLAKESLLLFSPWFKQQIKGSYFFRGSWQSLDQFMLGPSLFDNSGYSFLRMEVLDSPIITQNGKPKAWRQRDGYSDHLPILLVLQKRD